MQHFGAIIVGAGQAGPSLAGRLTAAGQRVAIVERKLIGGTCVNTGCIPTKTLVASARAAHMARRGADYGIKTGPVSVDMAKVKARKDAIMLADRQGVESWLGSMDGCSVIRGHARFEDPHTLRVGDDLLRADRIFLNVGGRVVVPDIPGLSDVDYLTNVSILELNSVPTHLVIVGGSYIALEFAQMYRRFGSRVTVVERGPRLAFREDGDVSAAIMEILEAEGIDIVVGADDVRIAKSSDGFELTPRVGADPVAGTHLLLAVGRRPNTDDLGLEAAGVQTDARGYIVVDDQLKTSVDHIWAMGDCNGKGAFTHTSYNDFEIVAANLLDGDSHATPRRVSDRITTYALYIDPPLGRAGMTAAQVRASGRKALVGKRPMTRVGRAVEKGLFAVEGVEVVGASLPG
jgi:pyruvate/2-oxoglutarate dehydrogenase complex dihydrolipoamide dehydrogenase (E3) component